MTDPDAITTSPPTTAADAVDTVADGECGNCGTPLLGPHCYHCGQPVNGLVRHFTSIVGDFFDSVFDLDARTFRTIGPLFFRPGLLSREYFSGRRVRFVSPVRLFFFLSIVTFFVAQFTIQLGDDAIKLDVNDPIARATTVAQVEAARDEALQELAQARDQVSADIPGARAGIDAGSAAVRNKARTRIQELEGTGPPGESQADTKDELEGDNISFNSRPWDPVSNPVKVSWLPGFANHWINEQVGRGKGNIARLKDDPNLLKDAVLGALPSTLFVLLPIFALMLKVAYFFKRRLYMEHLIVALHSHAFLCLALLTVFALIALGNVLPATAAVTGFLEVLIFIWMPLYLLLMQKRVYGQGWPMTLLKYAALGFSYVMLLSFGVAFTMLASLVWM